MSENTKIEWADHTFNPWVCCTKVSPACDHCYTEGWAKRSGMVQWGPHAERRRTSERNWRQPIKWNADLNPEPNTGWHECMRNDLKALLDCDALALLDGWQRSAGTHLEMHVRHLVREGKAQVIGMCGKVCLYGPMGEKPQYIRPNGVERVRAALWRMGRAHRSAISDESDTPMELTAVALRLLIKRGLAERIGKGEYRYVG